MTLELYVARIPAGTSFFYKGRVYELPQGEAIRRVQYTIQCSTWTAVLNDARKVTLEQHLEIIPTEPEIPNVSPMSDHGYAPLPKRDFDFLVAKAAKLAKKKPLALKRDDMLRKQHERDSQFPIRPPADRKD